VRHLAEAGKIEPSGHRVRHLPQRLRAPGSADIAAPRSAFVVATWKLAHDETTGSKLWIDRVTTVGGVGARQEALHAALEYRQADPAAWGMARRSMLASCCGCSASFSYWSSSMCCLNPKWVRRRQYFFGASGE
jgi:hypothetical protein